MVAPYTKGRLSRSLVRITGSGSHANAPSVYYDFSRVSAVAAMMSAQHPPPQAFLQPPRLRNPQQQSSSTISKIVTSNDGPLAEAVRDNPASVTGVHSGSIQPDPRPEGNSSAQTVLEAGIDYPSQAELGGVDSTQSVLETGANSSTHLELGARETPSPRSAHKRSRKESEEEVVRPPVKTSRVMYMAVPVLPNNLATSSPHHIANPLQEPRKNRHSSQQKVDQLTNGFRSTTRPGTRGPSVMMVQAGPAVMMTDGSMKQLMEERNHLLRQNIALFQKVKAFQQLFRDKNKLTSVLNTLGIDVV